MSKKKRKRKPSGSNKPETFSARDAVVARAAASAQSGFDIRLELSPGLSQLQKNQCRVAATHWRRVIIGDLSDQIVGNRNVDDLVIFISAVPIPDFDVLAQAAPTNFRPTGTGLPFNGFVELNSRRLADMERDDLLLAVLLHEIGHVLGIGIISNSLWSGFVSGAGTFQPVFTGSNASRAYARFLGLGSNASRDVPLVPAADHWDDDSKLKVELMTANIDGSSIPLSAVTIGALKDLGYDVDETQAEPLPSPALAPAIVGARASQIPIGRCGCGVNVFR